MKTYFILLCSLLLAFGAAQVSQAEILNYVDIGNLTSESGHNLIDWGPIWNMDDPGFFGAWGGGPSDGDRTWRTISHQPNDQYDWASLELDFGSGGSLSFIHLEGIALDSFTIHIGSVANSAIFTYPGDPSTSEVWFDTSVPVTLTGQQTIVFNSTGQHWSGYETFGQVAFSSITVETAVPEPSALILLGWGLIGIGVFRRKFRKS